MKRQSGGEEVVQRIRWRGRPRGGRWSLRFLLVATIAAGCLVEVGEGHETHEALEGLVFGPEAWVVRRRCEKEILLMTTIAMERGLQAVRRCGGTGRRW